MPLPEADQNQVASSIAERAAINSLFEEDGILASAYEPTARQGHGLVLCQKYLASAYEPTARQGGGIVLCQKENPNTAELNAILAKIETV